MVFFFAADVDIQSSISSSRTTHCVVITTACQSGGEK
jgi:hypothetical protein